MENPLVGKLLEKSIEAFVMAIELYNKPTIRYRVEGFGLFVCNAWELMLKAYMLKQSGDESIYYKDNPNRTISLEICVKKVFTNDKDPLRINIEKIIELRNTSTHFITEEYEMVYIPLFQACILNFNEKMQLFHGIDMTEIIPQNFLTLSVSMKSLNAAEIRAKYPEKIAERIINTSASISELIDVNNQAFAIKIEHYHYITKKKEEATSFVKIDNKSDAAVSIIKELKDPNDTHKFTAKKCLEEIEVRLKKQNIHIKFNMANFINFCKYYCIKENPKFCYIYRGHAQPSYTYSIQTIDFIVEEIKKDPENIIQNLKDHARKNK